MQTCNIREIIAILDEDPADTVRITFPVYARGSGRVLMERILRRAAFLDIKVDISESIHRFFSSYYTVKLKGEAGDIKIVMEMIQANIR